MPIELAKAVRWSEHLKDELRPYCCKIETVGSIRRERPMVGDLDFVVLTTISQVKAVKDRCLQNATEVLIDGPQNFVFTVGNGVQIDIFFARPPELELFGSTPGNWGTLMLCRTGSRQFNAWLCNEAKKRGAHWDPYTGVWGKDGRLIPCEDDEREVFQAIGVDYVPPTKRER